MQKHVKAWVVALFVSVWSVAFAAGSSVSTAPAFVQDGAGAVARLQAEKLKEFGLSVKDFGAKGDGIADDTLPVKKAIAVAATKQRGAVVFFPAGVYRVTEPIVVDSSGVILQGVNQKGATSYAPVKFAGSQIIYDANDGGPAVKVGSNVSIMYSNQIRDLRISAANGLVVKPVCLSLNALSEFLLSGIDINGACSVGIEFNAVTIGTVRDYNIAANDVGVRFVVNTTTGILASSNLWFSSGNIWNSATDAVQVAGNVNQVIFRDQWIEYAQNAFHFKQESAADIVARVQLESVEFSNGGSGPANSRFIRGTALAGSNKSLRVFLTAINSRTFNSGSTYNVEYTKGTNTGPNSFLEKAIFENSTFYGASTAVLSSDSANSAAFFSGRTEALNGYAAGASIPLVGGSARLNKMVAEYGYWDMSGGYPVRLPTVDALSYATAGQAWFQEARARLAITANGNRVLLPRPLVATYADEAVTVNVTDSAETLRFNSPLTADRVVTLSTASVYNGAKFRILRTAAATGAFNLNVGSGMKLLSPGQWCDVEHDGIAWRVTAAGSL